MNACGSVFATSRHAKLFWCRQTHSRRCVCRLPAERFPHVALLLDGNQETRVLVQRLCVQGCEGNGVRRGACSGSEPESRRCVP